MRFLNNISINKEQIVSISVMTGVNYFLYYNNEKLCEINLNSGFLGAPLYGHSFESGNKNSPEKPFYTSQNRENVITINSDYSNEEVVVTLAHEIVHVYNYINGNSWSDMNPVIIEQIKLIENLARESFNKW
jgi:Zn-dependent peptidase ImmA (M78 family)